MKKHIALVLVITFIGMNCAAHEKNEGINLEPGQKPGAKLLIKKKDGEQIGGELIAVKRNSLLLKEEISGTDAAVDIIDVNVIKIIKKSKALLGAGIGLLAGGGLGWVLYTSVDEESIDEEAAAFVIGETARVSGLAVGLLGLISGTFIGALLGKDKTIQFGGKSESEIKEILKDLRKKARVPDFQ